MLLTNANQILSIDDFETKIVEVPKWGGSLRIKGLSISEYQQVEKIDKDDLHTRVALVLSKSIVKEDNTPIFNFDQAKVLANKNFSVVMGLYKEAMQLTQIKEGELEAEAKN